MEIILPHKYSPRKYQIPILAALDDGIKRAVWVCHRRAGKDYTIFNWLIKTLMVKKQSAYYILPTYSQAKKIIWEGMTKDGIRFLDCIPKQLILKKSEAELSIRFINGSLLQLVGSENYDRLVGTNPTICVFSEMALQNPIAWDYMRPILAENKGVAIFISTPRGHNHFWELTEIAKASDNWFYETLTVNETKAISDKDIDDERKSGMSEEMILQEFYCSFETGQRGSYYGRLIQQCYLEDRITTLRVDPKYLVYTAWDIGFGDMCAIIFYQVVGHEIRIIDHYENQGYGLDHYIQLLRQKKYDYGVHFMPHDGKKHDFSTGKTILDTARETEFTFEAIPNDTSILDGIEKVRSMFPNLYFDRVKCDHLLKCLQQYHADYDDRARVFRNIPRHDWASHSADALRILSFAKDKTKHSAMTHDEAKKLERLYRNIY